MRAGVDGAFEFAEEAMRRALFSCALVAAMQPLAGTASDYPTDALADYVFACMASNGQSRLVLEQCSCSIDVIASILPYEEYVQAETVFSLRQLRGEKGALFRGGETVKETVAKLKRAQAEAEVRCF
jgi:hypothetical protein